MIPLDLIGYTIKIPYDFDDTVWGITPGQGCNGEDWFAISKDYVTINFISSEFVQIDIGMDSKWTTRYPFNWFANRYPFSIFMYSTSEIVYLPKNEDLNHRRKTNVDVLKDALACANANPLSVKITPEPESSLTESLNLFLSQHLVDGELTVL